jgi:hypothetical protein
VIRIPLRRTVATRALTGALSAVALGLATGPETAAAQVTLRGHVVDSELGHPLARAQVRVEGRPDRLTTDTLGWFEARALRGGETEVRIERIGYVTDVFTVHLPASGTAEGVFALDFTGHNLPAVVVEGRALELTPRYIDFERRRDRGIGAYLRWDELEIKGYASVGDALRGVRGVRIRCDQQRFECHAVMSRSPRCRPAWWIDGVEVSSFRESTPVHDVYGIEIYRGPGEIPGEFAGSNSACGVIVVWTKSRPYSR